MVIAFSVGLSGCGAAAALAEYQQTKPSEAEFAELKRRCAENPGVRWFAPQPVLDAIWLPGYKVAPFKPGDATVQPLDPVRYNLGADENWLATGRAKALIANIDGGNDAPHLFGPKSTDPAGWYRFTTVPVGHPRCAPYLAARAEMTVGVPEASPPSYCLTYDYIGPFTPDLKPAMLLRYEEPDAAAAGIRAMTVDLIVDSRLVARGQYFMAGRGVSAQYGLKECGKPFEVSDSLRPAAS